MFIDNISVFQKSTSNQNEIDLLWTQCEVQKKTIRSLHNEVDNTKTEFNQRFEKYKVSIRSEVI